MSKRVPRKRKIGTVSDEELMPPPQAPVSKRHKTIRPSVIQQKNSTAITDISNISTNSSLNGSIGGSGGGGCRPQSKTGPLSIIFEKVQESETLHTKYSKELTNIYGKMEHKVFMRYFLQGMRIWMRMEESNAYANVGLKFLAKYLSSLRCDDPDTITHPILRDTFDFLLKHISLVNNVRYRICQFVNLLLSAMSSEANIDDDIFDEILRYMNDRMKDSSSLVRVQAVYALQRLQIPENPDDHVVRLYTYHLGNDPSVQVRQAILKSIGRNTMTVPIILERLWDVDERVRRTTYLQMSSHPVRNYKVAQRLMLLEQGLNDHSESVRKILHNVLLPQWLQTYNKQYLKLISALKLDANAEEIQRFVKITKKALFILFKSDTIENLLEQLPLSATGEFKNCIPFEQLTVELAVFWLSIVEYVQHMDASANDAAASVDDDDDEVEGQLQNVICELSTFCEYLSKYINYMRDTATEDSIESWNAQENEYKLHILIEILMKFDLGDEIGRQNLNTFIKDVLYTQILGENVVKKLVNCVENLIIDSNARLQYFIDIIRSIIEPSPSINFSDPAITALIDSIKDPDVNINIVQLKTRIMELCEQEYELKRAKEFTQLEKVSEDLAAATEEFITHLNDYAHNESNVEMNNTILSSLNSKKASKESIQHCLEICYFVVCSKCSITLTPDMFKLYADFVQPHMKSQHMEIRDRALKCGIAFCMLNQSLAKEVYSELYSQFIRHHQPRLWTTAVDGVCEMFDRYGIEHFAFDTDSEKADSEKPVKKTRQLYNATADTDDQDDSGDDSNRNTNGTNVLFLFGHLFDTCTETTISMALTRGFCRLILGGHYETTEIISKIILKFFNPQTCTEINQILSVFFETLIQRGKQACLEKALLPTVTTILDAPHESALREIKADSVVKFVINSTMPCAESADANIHNAIARSFLKHMHEHVSNKELLKILSKELSTLEIAANASVRDELKELAETLLNETINDAKIESYINIFKGMMTGELTKRSRSTNIGSDDEQDGDENVEQRSTINGSNGNDASNVQNGEIKSTNQSTASLAAVLTQNSSTMDTSQNDNSTQANSSSPVPSISSSIIDQNKNSDDTTQQTAQNEREGDRSSDDDDAENSMNDRSVSTVSTGRRGKKPNSQTPKRAANKRNATNASASKDSPDENENCRVVTSTQQQSDDEVIPNTPTASPIVSTRNRRKPITSKRGEMPKSPPQKTTTAKRALSPKSNAKTVSPVASSSSSSTAASKPTPRTPVKRSAPPPARLIAEKIPAKSPTKSSPTKSPPAKTSSPPAAQQSNTKQPLSSVERRKRHRLSQARVQLDRIKIDSGVIRTRNALVAEFKENNIMTRKRHSLDKVKSPTQRMERLKKLTPAVTSPNTNGSTMNSSSLSNISSSSSNNTSISRKSARNSSQSSKNSSPNSITPLAKRRSVSSSPISANLKMLSENNKRKRTATATAAASTATKSKLPVPKRSASVASSVTSRQPSPAKRRQPNNLTNNNTSLPNATTRSRLPLRKPNRSASLVTLRKK